MAPPSSSPKIIEDDPSVIRLARPKTVQTKLHLQTASRLIAPDGMGRSRRNSRSNSTSNASFRYMPPTYRQVAPMQSKASLQAGPPPPRSQPARQLDHTVGRLETRPSTRRVRISARSVVRETCMGEEEIRLSTKCKKERSGRPGLLQP